MKPKYLVFNYKTVVVLLLTVLFSSVFFAACKKEKDVQSETLNSDNALSAPTDNSEKVSEAATSTAAYEGYGAASVGGANSSTVYHVTNLNSSGSGSLAAGIGSNRTIVFDVSGTIKGGFDLASISYLTIDATGQDITIDNNNQGDGISFDGPNTHHCILKGVHVTNAGNDGINVVDGAHDILITNCSSYGNHDGNIDVAGDNSGQTKNVTVQWCILGKGNSGWSGDMLVTGQNVSVHHNLFSPSTSGEVGERCPLVHSNYSPVGNPNIDFRNNVVWKWGRSGGTGSGYGTAIAFKATGNVINNYYYSTASTSSAAQPNDGYGSNAGSAYIAGNVSGNSGVDPNSKSNHAIYTIPSTAVVTTQSACDAASLVVGNAGPRPLNAADQAIINAITLTGCSGSGGGGGTTPPSNQAPTVNAGTDKTITLPTNSVSLTGTASDADGSIASYQWTKVSGNGGTIASATAATTNITGLTAGSYVFSLKVTDDKGATATDNVNVTVNSATPSGGGGSNQAPKASAGADKSITLPTNSVTFTGSGSDPDGTIASYQWTKEVGPVATIAAPASAQTAVTSLTAGSYRFRLTVTDNGGATGSDTVHVTVTGTVTVPNQAPIANAGADKTITLPTSSVTLSGIGTDADGSIASYQWTKVSGTGGSISSPASATTNITGLTAGSYVFSLKVMDNKGATATDNVNVTVNAASQGGGGTTTGYTQTYSNGYNSSSDINSNQLGRGGISTSIYNVGPGSFRSEVRAGDAAISSGWRSEQQYDGSTYNPTEGAVEYDVYYENWGGFDGGGHSIQWHPMTSGGSAIVSLQNYGGKFDVVRDPKGTVYHQSGTLKACLTNTWYHLRWEYKWSTGSDGYIRLYIDNALYYSFTGATADGSGQYLKIGQNRWPSGSGSTMNTTSVCYYDNLKIFRKG